MPTVLPSATVPMPTAVTVPMDTPPLSDMAATLNTEDSMANDLALAKQMGDSVLTAVQNFYDTYGEATYKQWQSLAADYDKADIAYNKKKVAMEETTYASEADRLKDYNELENLRKKLTDAGNTLTDFEKANTHDGVSSEMLSASKNIPCRPSS